MAIEPVSGAMASALKSIGTQLPQLSSTSAAPAEADAPSFGERISGALSNLNQMHNTTDALATQAATGDLEDVHDYTIAATQVELATQLTVAVRDRAVNTFNEIMRMPI